MNFSQTLYKTIPDAQLMVYLSTFLVALGVNLVNIWHTLSVWVWTFCQVTNHWKTWTFPVLHARLSRYLEEVGGLSIGIFLGVLVDPWYTILMEEIREKTCYGESIITLHTGFFYIWSNFSMDFYLGHEIQGIFWCTPYQALCRWEIPISGLFWWVFMDVNLLESLQPWGLGRIKGDEILPRYTGI